MDAVRMTNGASCGAAAAGCFVNGEIGPAVRGGACGWRGRGGHAAVRSGTTLRQSYTSVITAVGNVARWQG